jgi:hypothetical protein
MKTPNHRRPGSDFRLVPWLLIVGALFAASACAAPSVTIDTSPVTSASTIERSADEVDEALREVSSELSAQMTSDDEDLILAWNDFEGDVRSVVNDLIRNPSRVDIDGMQQRVESLEVLLDDSALELPNSEWEEFTSAFQTLIEEVTASSEGA